MINKVVEYVKKWNMIEEGDIIITGVSGGADSVCLLNMLHKLQKDISFNIIVAHIEHGIRGQESIEDAKFVKNLAEEYNLEYRQYSYEVRKMAQENHISEEEAGRKVRYEAFEKAAQEFGGNKIAVAHNQEDNAETMLMNLFRGSGLRGMGGIQPVRKQIIRPLMCLNRSQIEEYLKKQECSYRIDATNLLEEYTRNKLRHRIFPYIKSEINQQAVAHMAETAEQMQETYQFIEEQTIAAFSRCAKEDENSVEIMLAPFCEENVYIQKQLIRRSINVLTEHLKDITSVHIKSVHELVEKTVSKSVDLPYSLVAKREYNCIRIKRKTNSESTDEVGLHTRQEEVNIKVQIPGIYRIRNQKLEIEIAIEKIEKESEKKIIIPEKTCTKWLDCDRINSALRLRYRQPGDYLIINAENGKKKLKEYFIEQKIPQADRGQILLLADGSHIMWILGYRISEFYKVTDTTKNILKVQVNGGNIHERKN